MKPLVVIDPAKLTPDEKTWLLADGFEVPHWPEPFCLPQPGYSREVMSHEFQTAPENGPR